MACTLVSIPRLHAVGELRKQKEEAEKQAEQAEQDLDSAEEQHNRFAVGVIPHKQVGCGRPCLQPVAPLGVLLSLCFAFFRRSATSTNCCRASSTIKWSRRATPGVRL